jgi:hypothetical protein
MVDDVFRSYRNLDTAARDGSETSRGRIGDLLAELARLTGQGDPYRDGSRDDGSFQARKDDSSLEQRQRGEDQCALWRRQPSPVPREHGKQKKAPSNRHFSRPTAKFTGFPGKASEHRAAINKLRYVDAGHQLSLGRDDRQRVLSSPRAPTFLPPVSDDRHAGEMRAVETDESHGAYSFYDGLPSPRWRLVMVIVVLGLAWLGVASAFSYRAVFEGGAVLPTLPPLVAADNGPKEIVPNYGDARPSNSSQTSSSEKFVARWPADNQEPPEKASKASIVSAGSSEKFVARWPRGNQEPLETAQIRPAVPTAHTASTPPPAVAPPALTTPSLLPPAVPAPHSSEPKKIHTVIIRSDGSEQTAISAVAAAYSATNTRAPAAKPSTAAAR